MRPMHLRALLLKYRDAPPGQEKAVVGQKITLELDPASGWNVAVLLDLIDRACPPARWTKPDLVRKSERFAYCPRCSCRRSGFVDEPNVRDEGCEDETCLCHQAAWTQTETHF